VKRWVASPPPWIEVRYVTVVEDPSFRGLDPGEREAIILAEALRADALVMDDRAGRREAERRGLRVIGTLRVLYDAAEAGFLDLAEALEALQRSGFYVDPRLSEELLRRHQQKGTRNG
jgi:predicted nucleic acid-binding protein